MRTRYGFTIWSVLLILVLTGAIIMVFKFAGQKKEFDLRTDVQWICDAVEGYVDDQQKLPEGSSDEVYGALKPYLPNGVFPKIPFGEKAGYWKWCVVSSESPCPEDTAFVIDFKLRNVRPNLTGRDGLGQDFSGEAYTCGFGQK